MNLHGCLPRFCTNVGEMNSELGAKLSSHVFSLDDDAMIDKGEYP